MVPGSTEVWLGFIVSHARLVGKAFDPCQAGDEMMVKCFLGHRIQNAQK